MITNCIGYDRGGCYIEWYNDEDGTYARWYGPRADCDVRIQGPVPPEDDFWPVTMEGGPPHDAATATGMYDP